MRVNLMPASVIEAKLGIQNGGPIHAYFTAECARYMDPYVPYDKGNLAGTVIENGNINTQNVKTDCIIYNQPYAGYVYYGVRNGKLLNIKQDKHELATSYWDMHMWTAHSKDIVDAVQKRLNNGGK